MVIRRRLLAAMTAFVIALGITMAGTSVASAAYTRYFDGNTSWNSGHSSGTSPAKKGGHVLGASTFFPVYVTTAGVATATGAGEAELVHPSKTANQYCLWKTVSGFSYPPTQLLICKYTT